MKIVVRLCAALIALITLQFSGSVEAGEFCYEQVGHTTTDGVKSEVSSETVCVWINDSDPGVGDYGGEVVGGSGDGSFCSSYAMLKPENCDSPVAMPAGANYGQYNYAGGSGLARAIYLKDSGRLGSSAHQAINSALSNHTGAIAGRYVPRSEADAALLDGVRNACELQSGYSYWNYDYAVEQCGEVLALLMREANDTNFADWFAEWLQRNHVDFGIDRFSLSSFISLFAPDNSLTQKYNTATTEAKCHDWWRTAEQNGCTG